MLFISFENKTYDLIAYKYIILVADRDIHNHEEVKYAGFVIKITFGVQCGTEFINDKFNYSYINQVVLCIYVGFQVTQILCCHPLEVMVLIVNIIN